MNDLQGLQQVIERLEQIATDIAVANSGFQERSSEIKSVREAIGELGKTIRADVTALQTANAAKEKLLREEQRLATTKDSATNVQELARQLRDKIASEVRDGLRGLWRLTLGLTAGVVLLLGWMYFRDPASTRLQALEKEVRTQERLKALEQYVQPDGKGGWVVQIQRGSVFKGADGQTYGRLPVQAQ